MTKHKRSYQCRHCRKRYVPEGNGLAQTCPHCGKLTSKRTATRAQMVTLADDLFSVVVRYKASTDGKVVCVTCRRVMNWKDADAGHFMVREKWPTRYHWKNVHPQCGNCNGFEQGRQYQHGLAINEMYGDNWAGQLIEMSGQSGKQNTEELAKIADSCYLMCQEYNLDVSHIIKRNRAAAIEALGI